ncbi:MAG: OmpH family outer membrane protein [Selenomonadaceae bacterium]|nr:OmpH family outer membrane protein [Selenomonadaceae bacterium]
MIKLEKKQVKFVSILIAVIFIGSVVAIALTQTGNIASAASSSNVGVVEYDKIIVQHPDMATLEEQLKASIDEIKKEFDEKSASMNDQEKQDYYMQCQERILQRREELLAPVVQSVDAAIKAVADKRGLSVVLAKAAVVYGGQDITQEVVAQLGKKK